VSVGWLVVPIMCLIGLALTVPVVRNRRTAVAAVPAS